MFKKYIDRRPQRGQGLHRIFKGCLSREFTPAGIAIGDEQMLLGIGADISNFLRQKLFRRVSKKPRIAEAIECSSPIFFFFGAQNIGGAAIAR